MRNQSKHCVKKLILPEEGGHWTPTHNPRCTGISSTISKVTGLVGLLDKRREFGLIAICYFRGMEVESVNPGRLNFPNYSIFFHFFVFADISTKSLSTRHPDMAAI
ncbi:hypothetical protein I7I51_02588 [Histoplasma capsulatum]|uniref:Uncharacterized protein n=1 Tax=Ajellomyces capsulatus TaxID=5037 RepID=A0A8A1MAM6_AJECA|nr:hypothetical protein I7I51_02588 [Histoplasma capsulatum]